MGSLGLRERSFEIVLMLNMLTIIALPTREQITLVERVERSKVVCQKYGFASDGTAAFKIVETASSSRL
jgi:hypothetical protein